MASTNMITYIRGMLTALVKCFVMAELYDILNWDEPTLLFLHLLFQQFFLLNILHKA